MSEAIRVLHVDDDPEFADLTATFLEQEDDRLVVENAVGPKEGLERLADFDFDCIVSDHDMPYQDGIEFLKSVRQNHPDIPFILFTGKGSEEVASEAISAGVTDYLQKESGTEQYTVLANRIAHAVDASLSREMLHERTQQLETLIDNLPGIVYRSESEPRWEIDTLEGEVEQCTGYTAEAIESGDISWGEDIIHPEDREQTRNAVQEGLTDGGIFEVTYRIVTEDGTVRWMRERGRGVYTDDGTLDTLEGLIIDITERRERERALEEARMKLDALGRAFPDVAFIKDVEGNYLETFAGPETESLLFGGPEAYESERHVSEVFDGDTLDRALASIREAVETGEIQSMEYQLTVPAGRRWFGARIAPLEERIDGKRAVVWVARDITERKERERELEETRERMEFALDATDSIIFETDIETGNVTRHGPAERIYGGVPNVGAETFYEQFVHPDDRERIRDVEMNQATNAEAVDFEFRTHPDLGDICWIRSKARRKESGGSETLIGLSTDVTESKERERELTELNERLEEFVSIVSHDLQNPLTVAKGRLTLAQSDCESPHIDDAIDAIDRSQALVEDLLTLAWEDGDVTPERVSLATVAEECWGHVDTADATLAVEAERSIRADPRRFRQLLENLYWNAIEHGSQSDGRLGSAVRITIGELDDGFFIEDDGPGIPEAERAKVFDAGYSTADEGTGFGLNIVQQIVDAHGWQISATDGRDGGARFEITGVTFAE